MRDLHQHPAAVPGLGIRADRAAMDEIAQDIEALRNDRMATAVLHVRDEADAARVLLVPGMVEARGGREARIAHHDVAPQRVRHARGECAGRIEFRGHDPSHGLRGSHVGLSSSGGRGQVSDGLVNSPVLIPAFCHFDRHLTSGF